MRALYTLLTLASLGLLYLLMLKGWRSRQRRQSDLPPPPVSAGPSTPLLPTVPGLFIGTTSAEDWLDRIAVHGLAHRASGWLTVADDGVHVEREGLPELYLPYDRITQAATGDALAGKVVGKDGLLLLDWRLGDRLLTSGFRADDHAEHARLADAISARLSNKEPA